jgi:hypothetical protein
MATTMQTTVERLDKPSAYYLGRVRVAETFIKPLLVYCGADRSRSKPEQEAEV